LLVTNDSNASVVIPKTLDWNGIDDGHASQTFWRANLLMQMKCLQYSSGELDHLAFYGSEQRPETEVMLKPGESVRILGSGLMPFELSEREGELRGRLNTQNSLDVNINPAVPHKRMSPTTSQSPL
jgi:hypothetical protein